MKHILAASLLFISFALLADILYQLANVKIMTISSSAFVNSQSIPAQFTCDGENISPPLNFIDVPSSSQSLILIVDDPDAPGGTWLHWLVYNIDPTVKGLVQGEKPKGEEGVTSFGKLGYGGPCPPSNVHHYHFKLYALDQRLTLPEKATLSQVQTAMKGHIVSQAEMIGLYSRSK
ncbi:MAG TPA: YbhB/YbcL family Raf kinase inhibitor-like protein [Patescibacteria group bacterium]|nr:YbhB/YbcL family Raf kinase inhibitor-like protein [Patescibacteria group bacterium]